MMNTCVQKIAFYNIKNDIEKKDNKKQFFECLTSQFFSYIENFFDNLLYFNEYIALLSMFFSTINLNFSWIKHLSE